MFRNGRLKTCILIIAPVAAVLAAVALYVRINYTVRTVYVDGNVHYTEEEIRDIVMSGPLGDNSLWLSLKYKNKGIKGVPFVDVMDVEILSPDTIKIIVYEKTLTGCVEYMDAFVYFDKDGYVVESSGTKTAGVPGITGLEFDHFVTGEKLPVKNEEIFDSILNLTKLLQKYGLVSDKIYFNKSEEITIWFGDIRVTLGNDPARLEDKLNLLPELLSGLEGRKGVLRMQTYDGDGGKYSFKPDE